MSPPAVPAIEATNALNSAEALSPIKDHTLTPTMPRNWPSAGFISIE